MPTHQEIGGMSDAELLQRMVTSHPERYGEAFWEFFTTQVYLASRTDRTADPNADRRRWFRLFPAHNKYTPEDWQWLLTASGFLVQCSAQLRPHFQVFVTTPLVGA